jgi:hypothetical protein
MDGPSGNPGEAAKDETKPEPKPVPSPPENLDDTAAPDQPQSDLVLKKLRDILDKNEETRDLEEATGMSRSEMEQFVRKFEKKRAETVGKGREIEIKRGEDSAGAKPSQGLTGINPKSSFSTRTSRDAGFTPKDSVRGNVEGVRYQIPPELRRQFQGYVNQLSRSKGSAARTAQPGAKSPPNAP